MLPVRPRRPRHPAHRDGLPAARPGHLASTSRPTRAGSAGRSAGSKDRVLGPRRAAGREGGRARAGRCAACVATGRGIPRPGMSVSLTPDVLLGEITSGTFSPTLRKGIGLALVPSFVNPEAEVGVDVRGRREIFQLTTSPLRRAVRARGVIRGEPARPAPDLPPAQRRPSAPGGGGSRTPPAPRSTVADGPTPASGSPPRPTPSRGSVRSGPTWPPRASTRSRSSSTTAQVYGPMSLHA